MQEPRRGGKKKLLMKSVHIFCSTQTSKRDKQNFATNMQTESVTHTLTRRESWKTWLPFRQLSSGKSALLRRGSENYLFPSDTYSILSHSCSSSNPQIFLQIYFSFFSSGCYFSSACSSIFIIDLSLLANPLLLFCSLQDLLLHISSSSSAALLLQNTTAPLPCLQIEFARPSLPALHKRFADDRPCVNVTQPVALTFHEVGRTIDRYRLLGRQVERVKNL